MFRSAQYLQFRKTSFTAAKSTMRWKMQHSSPSVPSFVRWLNGQFARRRFVHSSAESGTPLQWNTARSDSHSWQHTFAQCIPWLGDRGGPVCLRSEKTRGTPYLFATFLRLWLTLLRCGTVWVLFRALCSTSSPALGSCSNKLCSQQTVVSVAPVSLPALSVACYCFPVFLRCKHCI